jgi:hypothetical protein
MPNSIWALTFDGKHSKQPERAFELENQIVARLKLM